MVQLGAKECVMANAVAGSDIEKVKKKVQKKDAAALHTCLHSLLVAKRDSKYFGVCLAHSAAITCSVCWFFSPYPLQILTICFLGSLSPSLFKSFSLFLARSLCVCVCVCTFNHRSLASSSSALPFGT